MNFAQPFQDYELLDRVGAGAMGTVFKAKHKKLNRIVALKVLKPSLARDSRYVERLRREARIVASLSHPHIVTGYDLGEEGGYHFFVMEFVEGKSLRALLVEWGMFAEEYVLKVGQQVAQALDHAYQRGVIHRDIKPGNILIDEQGNVKLTDMGLAKGPADLTLTRDGATVGTPQYISPEQARNPQDVDVRSDLYSLGATLYHMATGVPPFRGDTMAELITKVLHDAPVPPNEINPALTDGMSLVLRKLLAKDLRVRYQTPRELLDDLDRVQRSLPPQVDTARLSASETPRFSPWRRAVAVLAIASGLGLAVWFGMQLREEAVAISSADRFLDDLDETLRSLPTPGERLLHLRAAMASPPPGNEVQLLQRQRAVEAELQAAVDLVVAGFLDAGWTGLVAWLRDPAIWPERQRCEVERIQPRLRERTGLLLAQLPANLAMRRLDELLAAIDRELAERETQLLRRFEAFLDTTLPVRADEKLRAGDFAGADRLWRDALTVYCDGGRTPLPELWREATLQKARDRHTLAWQRVRPALDAAESVVADALREEAAAVLGGLAERLAAGAPSDAIAAAIRRLRQDLLQVWPAASRFRAGRDPWPEIERQLGELQQAVAVQESVAAWRRFDRRLDLAWRAMCHGSPADALLVLEGLVPPSPRHETVLAQHRAALAAARAVADAMLAALARANGPVVAFPRSGGGFAVELRVESEAGGTMLVSQAVGQPARRAALTEFRFDDLLLRLRQAAGEPLAGIPLQEQVLGSTVLAMVGEELAGIGARVQQLGQAFLLDDVWPRILRVRQETEEASQDRRTLFARLRTTLEAAERSGSLVELEASILSCEKQVGVDELSDAERLQLRAASAWLKLERRRRAVAEDLGKLAPVGSEIDVVPGDDGLVAEVSMPASVMLRDAADGWLLRHGVLEFAGGQRPWAAVQRLQCDPGIDAVARRTTAQIDIVLPGAGVGRRVYVFEFRGVTVLLALSATDAVHVALVDGDGRREDLVDRAFHRAMLGAFDPPRAVAIPGAVHRLTIDVVASPRRQRAAVRVLFEGIELVDEARELDPQRGPAMVLYPLQEIAVRQVRVRATGL